MLKVGDTVKVKKETMHYGERIAFIPIGTICRVVEIKYYENKEKMIGIIPEGDLAYDYGAYWYLECEVEKGHLEWVKDE